METKSSSSRHNAKKAETIYDEIKESSTVNTGHHNTSHFLNKKETESLRADLDHNEDIKCVKGDVRAIFVHGKMDTDSANDEV